ncbi:lytic transglycosylase domain-containing protein [Methylobacillus caricis]|uniref:lytic transglycosylase domain-containing protein n=1 Tax=Methylobacillus caricis TaxID=1971611 RepID=UPI001D00146E|nr:lytic transglycosylase domain-containing protein [Methylobacillus caricis]MCB5188728.1 lytic transglycosylase domain-containing protein [Methylobacillus caricis]
MVVTAIDQTLIMFLKLPASFIIAIWVWLSLMPESRADICLHAEAGEEVYISNTEEQVSCALLLSEHGTAASNHGKKTTPDRLPYMQVVARAAEKTSIDPALLHAVIQIESGHNAQALSRRGAQGLMQLMPATARQLGVNNMHDPAQNVMAGARYLSQLQRDFNGDIHLALAAYNAGPAAVKRHGNIIPPYAETQAYVPRVLQAYQRISGTY